MGLALTEILMACEEEFDCTISDDSLETYDLDTVGSLYSCIMRERNRPPTIPAPIPNCPNVPVFFALRGALIGEFGASKSRVTPSTKLCELFPRHTRKTAWTRLRKTLPYSIPEIRTAVPYGVLAFFALTFGLVIALCSIGWPTAIDLQSLSDLFGSLPLFAGVFLFVTISMFALFATTLEVRLPVKTIGDLVEAVVKREFGRLDPEGRPCHPTREWHRYQNLIADHLGIDPKLVTPEATFRELGAD